MVLLKILLKMQMKIAAEYRVSFWVKGFFLSVGYTADIIMIILLIRRFNGIAGWQMHEVAFLYGFNTLVYTISATFFGFSASLSNEILSGQLDNTLLLPVNLLKYSIIKNIGFSYISRIILTLFIILWAFDQSNLIFSWSKILYLISALAGGVLIQGALFLLLGVPAFIFIQAAGTRAILMGLRFFCNYPLDMYGQVVKIFLTVILPLGLINYYPAEYIFGIDEDLFPAAIFYMSVPVGLVLMTFSILIWQRAQKFYQSTGS